VVGVGVEIQRVAVEQVHAEHERSEGAAAGSGEARQRDGAQADPTADRKGS